MNNIKLISTSGDILYFELSKDILFMSTNDEGCHTLSIFSIPIKEFLTRLGYESK